MRDLYFYRWRLLLLDLSFALVEAAAVLLPLDALFGWPAGLRPLAGGLFLVAAAVWTIVMRRLRAPLDAAIVRRRAGQPVPAAAAERAALAATRLGWRSLGLRVALTLGASGVLGVVAITTLGLPGEALPVLLGAAALYAPLIDSWRVPLYDRLLRGVLSALQPEGEPLRRVGAAYRAQLIVASLCTAAPAMLAALAFALFFVSASPARYLKVQLFFPPVPIVLFILWTLWVYRRTRPIDQYIGRYIARQKATDRARAPDGEDPLATQAYRAAQLLPYLLGASKVLLWLCAALWLGVLGIRQWGIDIESTVLLLGETVLVTLGAALYEVLWHRATLAPLLTHLALRRAGRSVARTPLSLRTKMLVAFGTLTLFACGLSLFWSVMQYKTVATRWDLAVMIAQPGHRGGDLDTETRILIGFFSLLLLGSMGVVVLTAADLTRPIRELERCAAAIALGDLGRPMVPVAVETDEIGGLYRAFEEMRCALSERFRSSTEIHFALEAQVARRTAELERRNRELKEALEALQHAQEQLLHAEKMASMGRLVAGIAHEINNPVNAVVNTAGPLAESLGELVELVRRPGDERAVSAALQAASGDMRDMLRVVQRGARRTKEIVQALHHYSRGDGGLPAPVDIHRCLDESLDLLGHYLKQGIEVVRDYSEVGRVEGYAGQLQQVFMNLLTNAAQALGEHAAGVIRISTGRRDDRAVIVIADNGPGIPQAILPRIFDPFFTTKDVGQGSGLGLSIVHSIVERHGGTIAVDTQVGKGTRFTVTLPSP